MSPSRLQELCFHAREEGRAFPAGFKAYGIGDEPYPVAYQLPDSCKDPERWLENKLYGSYEARQRMLREAGGRATASQIRARVEFYGGLCWMCREAPYETLDHVIPVTKGGTGWPANLRPACRSCNSSKKDRWPL